MGSKGFQAQVLGMAVVNNDSWTISRGALASTPSIRAALEAGPSAPMSTVTALSATRQLPHLPSPSRNETPMGPEMTARTHAHRRGRRLVGHCSAAGAVS
jgi:hypothetical protein